MTTIQAIILGIIQGISEFLPISSSGHLNLIQHFFNLQPSLVFDIFLNTATLISVLFFFRNKLSYFFKNLPYIIVGSIPAALAGILLKHQFETIFADIKLLPFFFLITTAFVFSTKFLGKKSEKLTYKKALIIGLIQAVAILPAVSRAGSTIFAGLLLGLASEEAFNFSFCLFIPASIGALLLDVKDIQGASLFDPKYLITFIITAVVGIISLSILKKVLIGKKFWYFSIYTFILAIVTFFIL
jgi:undecaprenyl-diphosphatase